MFAKINHVAMVSTNYAMLGKFYEVLFGMKTSANGRPESAVSSRPPSKAPCEPEITMAPSSVGRRREIESIPQIVGSPAASRRQKRDSS